MAILVAVHVLYLPHLLHVPSNAKLMREKTILGTTNTAASRKIGFVNVGLADGSQHFMAIMDQNVHDGLFMTYDYLFAFSVIAQNHQHVLVSTLAFVLATSLQSVPGE